MRMARKGCPASMAGLSTSAEDSAEKSLQFSAVQHRDRYISTKDSKSDKFIPRIARSGSYVNSQLKSKCNNLNLSHKMSDCAKWTSLLSVVLVYLVTITGSAAFESGSLMTELRPRVVIAKGK